MSTTPPPPPPPPPASGAPPPAPAPPPQPGAVPLGPAPTARYYVPPDHPRATIALILGILGIVTCQVVAPFALVIGRRALKEIDASNGAVGGRGSAQAGYIMGIIGTVLLGLFLVGGIIVIIVAAASSS